jgi:hypothetical protein
MARSLVDELGFVGLRTVIGEMKQHKLPKVNVKR